MSFSDVLEDLQAGCLWLETSQGLVLSLLRRAAIMDMLEYNQMRSIVASVNALKGAILMMEQASLTIGAMLLEVFKEVPAGYSFVLITVLFATPFGQLFLPVSELAEISILAAGLLHPQIA